MKRMLVWLAVLAALALAQACGDEDETTNYDPPEDHTMSKEGVLHKPGLNDPQILCAACHAPDLKGGAAQVSCYECHEKLW